LPHGMSSRSSIRSGGQGAMAINPLPGHNRSLDGCRQSYGTIKEGSS
jgi:hypothetical protein